MPDHMDDGPIMIAQYEETMLSRNLHGIRALYQNTGIMVCPDNHRCENYSHCTENPVDEGSYYCDCDASPLSDEQQYAGLYCEHEATTYCTPRDSKLIYSLYHSFCTNGGTCVAMVEDEWEDHKGCMCKPGYVGRHCQFIEGSEVPNWMGNPNEGRVNPFAVGGRSLSAGGIVGLVFLASTVVGIAVLAVLYARKKIASSASGGLDDALGDAFDSGPPKGCEASAELDKQEAEHDGMGNKGSKNNSIDMVGDGAVDNDVNSSLPVEAMTSPMSADLHLDADGGVLKEAMKEQQDVETDRMDNEEGEDGVLEDAEIV